MRRWKKYLVTLFFLTLSVSLPSGAWGIITLRDDLELEGFVQAENILRTPRYRDAELILQRNTVQLEGLWNFIQDGRTTVGDFSMGPIEYEFSQKEHIRSGLDTPFSNGFEY